MANGTPTSFPDAKFTRGINGLSPINELGEGFIEDCVNMSPTQAGELVSREGSRTRAGLIPLRVIKVTYGTGAEDNIAIQVNGGPNFAPLQSRPLLIRGRTSAAGNPSNVGDFPNTLTAKIFDHFRVITAVELAGNGSQVFSDTTLAIPGCVRRTSFADRSALAAVAIQSFSIDSGTFDGTLTLDGDPAVLYSAWTLPAAEEIGRCYHHEVTLAQSDSVQQVDIPSATHGIIGVDYIIRAYHNTGSSYDLIDIDEVHISGTGNVSVFVRQNFAASADLVVVVLRAESVLNGTLTLGANSVLGPLSGAGTPYLVYACYYSDSGVWKECRPDELEYDAVTDEVTVTFNNLNGIPATSVKVCLLKFGAAADTFVVSGTQIGTGFTDYLPEMCVYGIDATELGETYAPNRLVDAYRDQATETPFTIHSQTPFMESSASAAQSTVVLSVLIDSNGAPTTQLGPVFSTEMWRTRGGIVTPDAGTSGLINNPAVVVDGNNLQVTIPLLYTSYGNPFGANDKLTLQRMFRPELDGVHPISSVVMNTTSIVFTIPNPAPLLGNLLNGFGGQVGVFTNYFTTFAGVTCPFLLGDILTAVSNVDDFGTFSGYENGELVCELSKNVSLPYNQTVIARRVASVIPLTASFLVQGASVLVDGEYRQVLGSHVGVDLDVVDIVGDGGAPSGAGGLRQAAARVLNEHYHTFNRGRKFLLLQAGGFTGEQVCTNVMWDGTHTTVFFDHTLVGTFNGGYIAGSSIEVAPIEIEAAVTVALPSRWHALEGLRDSTLSNRGPDDRPLCFEVDELMVSSGFGGMLYAASPNNKPIAVDPFGWRSTGMPDWNPIIGVKATEVLGPYIAPVEISTLGVSGITFTVAKGDENIAPVGELFSIRTGSDPSASGIVQVMSTTFDDTAGYITAAPISGTVGINEAGTLRRVATYRYYAQLRYVDSKNNVVVGPACGFADAAVRLEGSYAVLLTLVEPPNVGYVDYDRGVFIDVYRTKALYGTSTDTAKATYYKLTSLACTFSGNPYISYLDTLSDDLLEDVVEVSRTVVDSLGAGVSKALLMSPPRCKTMTSAAGYMVYGNLTGRPKCNITFLSNQSITDLSLLAGVVQVAGKQYLFFGDGYNITAVTNRSADSVTLTLAYVAGLTEGAWIYVDMFPPTPANTGYVVSGWAQVVSIAGSDVTIHMPSVTGTLPTEYGYYGKAYFTGGPFIPVPMRAFSLDEELLPVATRALRRLAGAISSVSAKTNSTAITARAGADIGAGSIAIFSESSSSSVSIAFNQPVQMSVNDTYQVQTATANFEEQLFPSRLALSGKGYAEVCGAYDYTPDKALTAIVDVNPSDGDEIIAIRPLLSESLFSDTQLQQILIVFKRRSIHAVDIIKRVNGASDYSQQIVSYGVGCCSPNALAHTEHGIVFAGRDSIYLLNKSLELSRIGELIERHLEEREYPADETIACRGGDRAYISWGSNIFVAKPYPQTEQWSRWELPRKVFGWTSVDSRALAGCQGRVVEFRTDLNRDDSVRFTSQATLRCQDFGDPSILKDLNEIVVDTNVRNVQVEFATEMRLNWQPCSAVKPQAEFSDDALTETYRSRRSVLRFACPAKKFQTLQIRVTLVGDISEAVAELDSGADSEVLAAAKLLLQAWIQRHGAGNITPTEAQLNQPSKLSLSRVVYKVRGGREKGTKEATD